MEENVRAERRSRAAKDESGQVLVLAALGMTMMLVMVALVVDIGKAYLVQRQLQAGVDAAALAGAQFLPDPSEATQAANDYGPSAGARNAVDIGSEVTTTVTMRCVTSAPGCSPSQNSYNAVNVRATSDVGTVFGRILGISKLKVKASATACSPCSAKPLDVMLVLDRTGSMCQTGGGTPDPSCTDLRNAKEGMRTFLQFMDPTLDKVGLAVFPPARNQSAVTSCPNRPSSSAQYYGYDAWWPEWGWPDVNGDGRGDPPGSPSYYTIVSMSDDYLTQSTGGWIPNPSSWMFQSIGMPGGSGSAGCIQGEGTTHYASAVEEAQHELDRNGRGDVQDVIIFLSDGAANTSPTRLPLGHWRNGTSWRDKPCGAGVQAAANAKSAGDKVYTIGYDLDAGSSAPERCRRPDTNGHYNPSNPVESGYDAYTAIQAMASPECELDGDGDGDDPCFYNKPVPGTLNGIFTRIAADLARPAARLIDDDTP
jgi:Flp pilus assembly protein TadG